MSKYRDMSTESESRSEQLRRFYRRLHLSEPDFTRPTFELDPRDKKTIMDKLVYLYGDEAEACFREILRIMRVYNAHKPLEMIEEERDFRPAERVTEKDVVLITYGDLIRSRDRRPLRALADFLRVFMGEAINVIHILPFFPSSSDRGFSIIDYEEVDPQLGSWEDIEVLSTRYRLMFDGVFNHVSSKSRWFQQFLNGNPHYKDFFIRFTTRDEVSEDHRKLILRPRVGNLLTGFDTVDGRRFVWTTFSPDQIDLNFRNIDVLVRVAEILLFYVRWGADFIRLDAVTYLWTELGTSCAHLRETHAVVQLFRAILDAVVPHVALVTETNVAHADNIGYFGDGTDEAQMVYNFALPPLVLFSFQREDCTKLSRWAATLGHSHRRWYMVSACRPHSAHLCSTAYPAAWALLRVHTASSATAISVPRSRSESGARRLCSASRRPAKETRSPMRCHRLRLALVAASGVPPSLPGPSSDPRSSYG